MMVRVIGAGGGASSRKQGEKVQSMLFDVWGSNTLTHWLGWAMVFVGLIVLNEVGRRTKVGAAIIFGVAPLAMTIYCAAIAFGVANGQEWALTNPTHIYQNSWFHYAKVYAALAGCWGFIAIKYQWGKIGKARWFRAYPFLIVAINIMIAVVSDFESAYHFFALGETTWVTSEGAIQLAGWNNVFNGIAGIINIFCMTGWWSVYASEDQSDMLWPDMTWVYIIAYDIWNFCYTYNCLPTHSWFCGFALLLAPTVAAFCWNKGGWIQNRAFTLAIWHVCPGLPVLPGREHLCDALPSTPRPLSWSPSWPWWQTWPRSSTLPTAPRSSAATPTSRTSSREPATGRRQPPAAPRSTTPPRSSKSSALVL